MNRVGGVAVALALVAAACSSSSGGGGGAVSGSVAGQSFKASDATGLVGQITASGNTANETDVALTSWSGACSSLMTNSTPANAGVLFIVVAAVDPVGPGTYDISSTGSAQVSFAADGTNCAMIAELTAQSGTVTYDTVTSTSITGSVDAVFSSGEVKGSFSASICNDSLSNVETLMSMAGTCQQ
jgi:hypothetical protein